MCDKLSSSDAMPDTNQLPTHDGCNRPHYLNILQSFAASPEELNRSLQTSPLPDTDCFDGCRQHQNIQRQAIPDPCQQDQFGDGKQND